MAMLALVLSLGGGRSLLPLPFGVTTPNEPLRRPTEPLR